MPLWPIPIQSSEQKVEGVAFEALVLLAVELVELGGLVGHTLLLFLQFHQDAAAHDLAPEVALVERRAEDGLVEFLQMAQGEFLRQQFKTDRLHAGLVLESRSRLPTRYRCGQMPARAPAKRGTNRRCVQKMKAQAEISPAARANNSPP